MMALIKGLVVRIFGDPFLLRVYQRPAVGRALAGIEGATQCLDVGAGDLGLTCWIKRTHPKWRLVACDLGFPVEARKRADIEGIETVVTDGEWLPSVPGGFEVLFLSSVLQMVPDPQNLLNLCRGALSARSGRLVLTVPAPYHFLPRIARSRGMIASALRRLCRLPTETKELHASLKQQFGAQGARDCFSLEELEELLNQSGFRVSQRMRTPGWLGTLAWEFSLLLSLRWGSKMFGCLIPIYPLVWLENKIGWESRIGEHLLVAVPKIPAGRSVPDQASLA